MTLEQRVKLRLGELELLAMQLQTQLDAAQKRIKELEAPKADEAAK